MLDTALTTLMKIREIADGRRHYRDAEGGEGCFDALGAIREICDKALAPPPAEPRMIECPGCGGSGLFGAWDCSACRGRGEVPEPKT